MYTRALRVVVEVVGKKGHVCVLVLVRVCVCIGVGVEVEVWYKHHHLRVVQSCQTVCVCWCGRWCGCVVSDRERISGIMRATASST